MLLIIRCIQNRLAGQPDHLTSLRDIVLKRSWRLDVFVRGGEGRVGKLSLQYIRVGVSKMSLPSLLEQSVPPVVFLIVQGSIYLFFGLNPRVVERRTSNDRIFVLDFLRERLTFATELKHVLIVGHLLRQLRGQLGRGVGVDSQRHEPGELLDNVVGRAPEKGGDSVEADLSVKVVSDCIRLVIEDLVPDRGWRFI